MATFDWNLGFRQLLVQALETFPKPQLIPRFDADGIPSGQFLPPLGNAPLEVWTQRLALDEPLWFFEKADDPVMRFIAVNLALGALMLSDSELFGLVLDSAHLSEGDDVADDIRWRIADVRGRLLTDLRNVVDRLSPLDVPSLGLLEWEVAVAFVTSHWPRLLALLMRYEGLGRVTAGELALLKGRLLFHSLTPKVPELKPGAPAKLSRLSTAIRVLQLAQQPVRCVLARDLPFDIHSELFHVDRSEPASVAEDWHFSLGEFRRSSATDVGALAWLNFATAARQDAIGRDSRVAFRRADGLFELGKRAGTHALRDESGSCFARGCGLIRRH